MKSSLIILIILILLTLSGWGMWLYTYKKGIALEQRLIDEDKKLIGELDKDVHNGLIEKEIILKNLEESKKRLEEIIKKMENQPTDSLNIDDALDIIKGLK